MQAGQRMVASDGYEVMLFPLPYLYISQDEGGSIGHVGTLNMDFLGWGPNGRIYDAPMYAPCSCKCVATYSYNANHGLIFTSLDKVHCADGVLRYVTFMHYHDENPIASVGDVFRQGDLYMHTGNYGQSTGDHTHFNIAEGDYQGMYKPDPDGEYTLRNSIHVYNACYVNDTVLYRPLSHTWLTYQGGLFIKRSKFPWVLYARKLREHI